jgi:hypothetical protein
MKDKIAAVWELFKVGSAIANPGKGKAVQLTATVIAGVLLALAHVYKAFTGHDLPLDQSTADAIGTGAIAIINVVGTLVTSRTIGVNGLQPAGEPDAEPMPSPQPARESAPQPVSVAPAGGSVPRVDDATRERAAAWLRQQEVDQYGKAGG